MNRILLALGTAIVVWSLTAGAQYAVALIIGFQSLYAPPNWTLTNSNADGSVDTSGAPASIKLTGSDLGFNSGLGHTHYTINIKCGGTIMFDWDYSTANDDAGFDPAGYLINGVHNQVTVDGGGTVQSGSVTVSVSDGDQFGFYVDTIDNGFGRGMITISDYKGPDCPVGGEILPVDTIALLVNGVFVSSMWIIPVLGSIAGVVIAVSRGRSRKQ